MNNNESRKHRRIAFIRDILLNTGDGIKTQIISNDISTSGMGLYADMPQLKGNLLHLTFDLIQNGNKKEINVEGEVKHVQLVENGYNFGVQFI